MSIVTACCQILPNFAFDIKQIWVNSLTSIPLEIISSIVPFDNFQGKLDWFAKFAKYQKWNVAAIPEPSIQYS